ncbi:MAG: TraB/GumN family protein, partial [bacterium]
ALLSKSFKDYPQIHKRLLLQRNKKWVLKVENLVKQNKKAIFIVGVGHLVGPGSVVDLLQKKGYKLKQR